MMGTTIPMDFTADFMRACTAGNHGLAPRYWQHTLTWIRTLPETGSIPAMTETPAPPQPDPQPAPEPTPPAPPPQPGDGNE